MDSRSQEDQHFYGPLFAKAAQLLQLLERTETPAEGHLGFVRIVRENFSFLQKEYSFAITREEPTSLRLSSGTVFVRLEYTQKSYRSCQFGLEAETGHFLCIRDILFLYHDDRYRSVPEDLLLNTSNDVEVWFRFVASVFRQYGLELLSNQPGLFDRLRAAQSKRDAEYVAAMDAESKKRHP